MTGTAITVAGTVADTNLTSTVALTALRVGAWTNTQNETTEIDGTSIGTLTAGTGGFAPTWSSADRHQQTDADLSEHPWFAEHRLLGYWW